MNRLLFSLAIVAALVPGASAQSPFQGTWKLDLNRGNFNQKLEEFLLVDGIYTCKACSDPTPLTADGSDHPYSGYPNADTVAVNIISEYQIEVVGKKDGTVVGRTTMTVTPDNQTLASQSVYNLQNPDDVPIRETKVWTRVNSGPRGSHAISGSWQGRKIGVSDAGSWFTYQFSGDQLTLTKPLGQGFTARLDGSEAPYNGDPATTSVRVKLVGEDTLEETYLRNGSILRVTRMTVRPDGKKARIVTEDVQRHATSSAEAVKQ